MRLFRKSIFQNAPACLELYFPFSIEKKKSLSRRAACSRFPCVALRNKKRIPFMFPPLIQYRRATPADFEGILHLQHQNLITTLRGEDLSHGFLTIEFTREQLHQINSELGICVAVQG